MPKRAATPSPRPRAALIHWSAPEAARRAARLEALGWEAVVPPLARLTGTTLLRGLRAGGFAAFVIDLGRLPSHGREVAFALRAGKATREVPIVFVDGDPAKVAALRERLPDAIYTTSGRLRAALERARTRPPAVTVRSESALSGYSGTPLPKKLGVKPGGTVALLGAPEGFEAVLGALPGGARTTRSARAAAQLSVWFVRSRRELAQGLARMVGRAAGGGLWIAWPKKASRLATDVGEADVRRLALAAGLVDFKVCAIDADWSGLRFSRRAGGPAGHTHAEDPA